MVLLCLCAILSYIPNASVSLKGIGVDCFPFYLDEETAMFRFPALTAMNDNYVSVSKLDKKPSWMRSDFRTFVRFSCHYPRWSIIGLEGFYWERYGSEYAEIMLSHSVSIKHCGFAYSIGYRSFPEEFEQKQFLLSGKFNYTSNNRLFVNIGASYGRIKPEDGAIHWILGPVIEARYSISPFVLFLSSRHPEDFVELDSLPLFHSNYMNDDYRYFYVPLEGGAALVQEFGEVGTAVLGVRVIVRYTKQSDEIRTSTMAPEDYVFVSGFNYNITTNIAFRAGFTLDYHIDGRRTKEIRYNPSMGGSLELGDRFSLDIATKSLSTPLNYDAAVKWSF